MSKIRYNKSKTYLLPLLSEFVSIEKKFFSNLINTYIYDDLNKYQNCLYVLHDFSFKNPDYTAYEHKLINNELFVDLIDIDDKVLYIFKFPEDYLDDYQHFINGKYSKFGEDSKELVLNFYSHIYKDNIGIVPFLLKVKRIFYKDEILRQEIEDKLNIKIDEDAELQDIINKENETFKLSKYLKDEDKNKKITPPSSNPFESN